MLKAFKHSFTFILAFSLLVSSVGYTVKSFACPKMQREAATKCWMCKETPAKKDCCQAKVEHKAVKSEFEKPYEVKSSASSEYLSKAVSIFVNYEPERNILTVLPISMHSVEKSILFSTFLI